MNYLRLIIINENGDASELKSACHHGLIYPSARDAIKFSPTVIEELGELLDREKHKLFAIYDYVIIDLHSSDSTIETEVIGEISLRFPCQKIILIKDTEEHATHPNVRHATDLRMAIRLIRDKK